MVLQTILPALLLAAGASAGFTSPMDVDGLMMGRDWAELERRMEHFGQEGDIPAHTIIKRQATSVTNANGSINMTAWEEEASKACVASLSQLTRSTNPSGTCVCYNLPALNNQTGAFAADLRLYQLSSPTGDFTGIPQQNIQVSLKYEGASVSPVSATAASKMVVARQDAGTPATTDPAQPERLRLLQTYMFVGQIDKTRMNGATNNHLDNRALLEALVMPVVSLSAVNNLGQTVSTTVSSNEAAFVAGTFANEVVMSSFSMANMAVNRALDGLGNNTVPFEQKTVPFVLPGVALMIFPVGLIITSIWTVGLVGAIGYGTFMRIGFRDAYRSRMARSGKKATLARI